MKDCNITLNHIDLFIYSDSKFIHVCILDKDKHILEEWFIDSSYDVYKVIDMYDEEDLDNLFTWEMDFIEPLINGYVDILKTIESYEKAE